MGTGLPLLIPNKESVSHILADEQDGQHANMDSDELKTQIKQLASIPTNRKAQASKQKERFAYENIAKQIIAD